MALNLRAKMPASITLIVLDVNDKAMKRFVEENEAAAEILGADAGSMQIEIAQNAREVADKSVCGKEMPKFLFHWLSCFIKSVRVVANRVFRVFLLPAFHLQKS